VKTFEPLFLSLDDVMGFHADQVRLFGGTEGVRDQGALESAVAMAQAAFAGEYLHDGIFEMAAAYAFHIAENQPFLDGNKRTALNAAVTFLGLNGQVVLDPNEELYQAMMAISRRELDKNGLASIFRRLSVAELEEDEA
jgi:death-on-curing protein